MPLTKEWLHRIQRWESALWQACYRPVGQLDLRGATTFDHLNPEQAAGLSYKLMPVGTRWGAKWEYGWFTTSFTLPPEAAGQRIVLNANPAAHATHPGECLVWVNGEIAGSFGWARSHLTLSTAGIAGTEYHILIEAYAGHGELVAGGGPVPYGTDRVIEPPAEQCFIGETSFGIWLDPVYHLALDFSSLSDVYKGLDPLSLRVAEVGKGLMDATLLVDPELPEEEFLASAQLARQRLQPLLACTNGTTAPTLYAFGHAHIDVAWLWPLAETERKTARTIANQLGLMAEYAEFRFLQSQPCLYRMLEKSYPELYARLKRAVQAGKIIPDGAMWVEADTNLSGGESLIRQVLAGRRFFREEFGVDSTILWLPDVFGYSGALPQIMAGSGCTGFATQKITWAYHGGEPFPYNTFLWQGIDGTCIPAHIFTDYNSLTRPSALMERWNTRLQSLGIDKMILSFGWGDGGGGPTRDHLEYLRRCRNLEGVPRVNLASPAEFFADLPPHETLPRYVGELYFQAHRGTYTSQAQIKKANRKLEFALREAEFWGCAAQALAGSSFDHTTLQSTWQTLMLHQFHDILPGSSIQRVYVEAEAALTDAIVEAQASVQRSTATLINASQQPASAANAFTVFNSLSWPRTYIVEIENEQIEVTIPPCGWTSIDQDSPALKMPDLDGFAFGKGATTSARAAPGVLENEHLRATFNTSGELISLVEKSSDWEVLAAPGNRMCMFKDVPSAWDAWDLDSMAELQPLELNEPASLEVVDPGPLVARLRLDRRLNRSQMTQIITLRRGSRRLEFDTTIDWQERHKLLKVAFPTSVHADQAIHEIQFGHLRRPTHRSRQYDADRFEVCNHKWSALAEETHGVAVLNDAKYGISVDGSTLKLTLLKSALAPDPAADRGIHNFSYAIYPWVGPFIGSRLVQEAYELNIPPVLMPGAGGERSLFQLDVPNIILEGLKPAEDGSHDLILRLYEAMHTSTHCRLSVHMKVQAAWQTDLQEEIIQSLDINNGNIHLSFRPFEIKTLRLKLSPELNPASNAQSSQLKPSDGGL